jgi:hypothetical protein
MSSFLSISYVNLSMPVYLAVIPLTLEIKAFLHDNHCEVHSTF